MKYRILLFWTVVFTSINPSFSNYDRKIFESDSGKNIVFILDASGSMMARMQGQTRLAIAKNSFLQLMDRLNEESKISLWVYGHRAPQSKKEESCNDIEELISFGPVNSAETEKKVSELKAFGYTPISKTLKLAAKSFKEIEEKNKSIVLISDGEETCDEDPCLVASSLKKDIDDLVVNTIGFAADNKTREQLMCIADVTGGAYFDARNADELFKAISDASAEKGNIQLVDNNRNNIKGIGISVYSKSDGKHMASGGSKLNITPGEYRVRVNSTIPFEATATVKEGETTEIVVPVNGSVSFTDENNKPNNNVGWRIVQKRTNHKLSGSGKKDLPPGEYALTTVTEYKIEFHIQIKSGKDTVLLVPNTGKIQLVNNNNEPVKVSYTLQHLKTGQRMKTAGSLAGQFEYDFHPGIYKARVRTKPGFEILVKINSGEKTTVNVESKTTNKPVR